jgi:hypothetical protein
MKKTLDKKLTLKPQTLRTLQTLELKQVAAGGNGTSKTQAGQTCGCPA